MAVKARENVQSKQFSIPTMVILFAVIMGYTFLYNQVIDGMDNDQLKTIIGIVALSIMMVGFIVSLRFITTSYEMTLTHDRLSIIQKIFFWNKKVADIGMNAVRDLSLLDQAKKVEGATRNFTLGNITGMRKYALYFEEQGKICCVKIQCSVKFYEALKKQSSIK